MKTELLFDAVAFRAIRQTLQAHKLPNGLPESELKRLVEMAKAYSKILTQDIFAHIREKYVPWKSEDELRQSMEEKTKLIHIEHRDGTRKWYHNIMCKVILGKKREEVSDDEAEAVAQCAKALDELF
jgi:hypothetical protein